MDLQDPTRNMSKTEESPRGVVLVLEDPASITRKIRRAVTDTGTEVRFDPVNKPGVSNLLAILAAATDEEPVSLAERYTQYGPLKADCAEAVVELVRPIQARYAELAADPAGVPTRPGRWPTPPWRRPRQRSASCPPGPEITRHRGGEAS